MCNRLRTFSTVSTFGFVFCMNSGLTKPYPHTSDGSCRFFWFMLVWTNTKVATKPELSMVNTEIVGRSIRVCYLRMVKQAWMTAAWFELPQQHLSVSQGQRFHTDFNFLRDNAWVVRSSTRRQGFRFLSLIRYCGPP